MIIEHGQEVGFNTIQNHFCFNNPPVIKNSRITFKGVNNILYVEDDVRIYDSNITFCGDNAIVYLSRNTKHPYKIKIDAWRGTTVFFGNDNYFNGVFSAIVSERQNLLVGNDGVFSFGIWLRTADPHIIYDINSNERINRSKSIVIGDHVWIGQNALILKGLWIGSGSIIAANSVSSGKIIESNSIWGGNPAKRIRSHIFFSSKSVHNFTEKQTRDSMRLIDQSYIYAPSKEEASLNADNLNCFLEMISREDDSKERFKLLKNKMTVSMDKNRFAFLNDSIGERNAAVDNVKYRMAALFKK